MRRETRDKVIKALLGGEERKVARSVVPRHAGNISEKCPVSMCVRQTDLYLKYHWKTCKTDKGQINQIINLGSWSSTHVHPRRVIYW